jgi:hypothetical protein
MNEIRIRKNEKGYSLIGVVMGSALSLVLILVLANLMGFGKKTQDRFTADMSFQQLRLIAMKTLMNPTFCGALFNGRVINISDLENSVPSFNSVSINGQVVIPDNNSRDLRNITIQVDNPVVGEPLAGNRKIYLVEITLRAQNANTPSLPPYAESFPLQFVVDETDLTSRKIVACYSSAAGVGALPPPLPPASPACLQNRGILGSIPLVTITSPGAVYPAANNVSNGSTMLVQVSATNCVDPSNSKLFVRIAYPDLPGETSLAGPLSPPAAVVGLTASFNYSIPWSALHAGNNTITAEVICTSGTSNAHCARVVLSPLP